MKAPMAPMPQPQLQLRYKVEPMLRSMPLRSRLAIVSSGEATSAVTVPERQLMKSSGSTANATAAATRTAPRISPRQPCVRIVHVSTRIAMVRLLLRSSRSRLCH